MTQQLLDHLDVLVMCGDMDGKGMQERGGRLVTCDQTVASVCFRISLASSFAGFWSCLALSRNAKKLSSSNSAPSGQESCRGLLPLGNLNHGLFAARVSNDTFQLRRYRIVDPRIATLCTDERRNLPDYDYAEFQIHSEGCGA